MHTHKCRTFINGVNLFISIRPAQFITREELMFLLTNFNPCRECCPQVSDLSQMTGRLYKIIWDKHMKTIDNVEVASIIDIIDGQERGVDE